MQRQYSENLGQRIAIMIVSGLQAKGRLLAAQHDSLKACCVCPSVCLSVRLFVCLSVGDLTCTVMHGCSPADDACIGRVATCDDNMLLMLSSQEVTNLFGGLLMMMSRAELSARVAQSPPIPATSARNCPTPGPGRAGTSSRIWAIALSLAGKFSLHQCNSSGCQSWTDNACSLQ